MFAPIQIKGILVKFEINATEMVTIYGLKMSHGTLKSVLKAPEQPGIMVTIC